MAAALELRLQTGVDEIQIAELLDEVNELLNELDIGVKAHHWKIPWHECTARTQRDRWQTLETRLSELEAVGGGKAELGRMLVAGFANTLCPRGHGAKAARKLGERKALVHALCTERNGALRNAIQKAFRQYERSDTHASDILQSKLRSTATYRMLDAFRWAMYQKVPSRGKLTKEAQLLVTLIENRIKRSGTMWRQLTEEDVTDEAAMLERVKALEDEILASLAATVEPAGLDGDARKLWRAYYKREFNAIKEQADASDIKLDPRDVMKNIAAAWKVCACV